MTEILSVPRPPSPLQSRAVALFQTYGDFLRTTHACGYFNYTHFLEEIATLPAPYTEHNGELLLAQVDAAPAACIAYRAAPQEGPQTCEIKRLFVLPAFRGHGLARQLITEVLTRVAARTFTRAILDTDTAHMPGAFELYTQFGFQPYKPNQGDIAFLDRKLP
jgi:GNAT superfamily N-acetyltransferase